MTPTWRSAFLKLLSVALAITVFILTVRIIAALGDGETRVLDAGDRAALHTAAYGAEHTLLLPEHQVKVRVAEPLAALDAEIIDDDRAHVGQTWKAPEGGRLVPVFWRITGGQGYPQQGRTPIRIRLVVEDKQIAVTTAALENPEQTYDAYEGESQVFAVADDVDLEEVTVEVESEGVTQVLHPATGKIDAGIAQPLYESAVSFDAGCTRVGGCRMETQEPSDSLRAYFTHATVDRVTEQVYDAELGWADEGTRWVVVGLNVRHGYGITPDATMLEPTSYGSLRVTLGDTKPVHRERLDPTKAYSNGRVVFQVKEGTTPRLLRLRQVYSFMGDPGKVTMAADLELRPIT